MKKQKGLEIIKERIEDFEKNKALIMKKGYGETNIRTNYIDVMFEALGWNIRNKYEVDREFSQKDKSKEANTKKVDYAFKINGKLKFFIEAKEASVDLEHNKDAIYQAKRYAYSSNGKAPIVILTDFEEFRVFNVLTAPLYGNPEKHLLKSHSIQYNDYIAKWDMLWNTFSREAVEKGSLDELRGVITKNTKTMDKDFLEQITKWRENLAKNIAIRNEDLSVDDINEAVQRILDRLIFIRNLEDREIEPENTLLNIANKKTDILKSLIPLFNSLNTTYNGLLYKPHFSEKITIDDKTLYDIIREMCYPISPFQFDIIEPEILGRIYEKFLGSKIRLTDSHRAKIEEKPEVRKAGGVYYTPEYIVDYIVKNTVGKKIEGLTPNEIKEIKIVDPACGSGSFLIGAYNYLLEYHRQWYIKNKSVKDYKSDWYKTKENEIVVNLHKRGEILQNNIFGVDIDKEATEVAIMSLYLKMLDDGFDKGERDLFFVKGAVLPDMTENIKCGNSLIDNSFFQGQLIIDHEKRNQINPFDWENKFNRIFENGGFDCVIGNPPYVNVELMPIDEKEFYKNTYKTFYKRTDLFGLFIDRALTKIGKKYISFIVPSILLNNLSYKLLRDLTLSKHILSEVCYTGGNVFSDVTIDTVIIKIDKDQVSQIDLIDALIFENPKKNSVDKDYFDKFKNNISINSSSTGTIADKVFIDNYKSIDSMFTVYQGIVTGNNPAFIFDNKEDALSNNIEENLLHTLCHGRDISRWVIKSFDRKIIYINSDYNLNDYPGASKWLNSFRNKLKTRRECKNGVIKWYSLQWPRNQKELDIVPKIAVQNTRNETLKTRIVACMDQVGVYSSQGINLIIPKTNEVSIYFVLGVINSDLINYIFQTKFLNLAIKAEYIKQIKIPIGNVEHENKIEQVVKQLIDYNLKIKNAKSERDKDSLKDTISILETNLNELVYDLYQINEEEKKQIESKK